MEASNDGNSNIYNNNLDEIKNLRYEIINDKKGEVRHDNLFKIIIIGSSGKFTTNFY